MVLSDTDWCLLSPLVLRGVGGRDVLVGDHEDLREGGDDLVGVDGGVGEVLEEELLETPPCHVVFSASLGSGQLKPA